MARRDELPAVGEYYHVFNRGVEKRTVFSDVVDYQRFLNICQYYLDPNPPISFSQRERISPQLQHRVLDRGDQLVEVVAYCLMPNHFHFLVRVVAERGLEEWIRRSINSYTRSFNTRWHRVGSLFQGPYKFVRIESNTQLLHVSRYIHLNAPVAGLVRRAVDWPWSSMGLYVEGASDSWVSSSIILDQMPTDTYQEFVNDHFGYASSIAAMKHVLIDAES